MKPLVHLLLLSFVYTLDINVVCGAYSVTKCIAC